jgi:hypothetical protein
MKTSSSVPGTPGEKNRFRADALLAPGLLPFFPGHFSLWFNRLLVPVRLRHSANVVDFEW